MECIIANRGIKTKTILVLTLYEGKSEKGGRQMHKLHKLLA